jgi:8-amino-7-oxononanoate synthase
VPAVSSLPIYISKHKLTSVIAIVLCSPTTRQYLINYARSLIYTTAMGYPMLAGIQTAYEYLESDRVESHLGHLRSLIQHTHRLLTSICTRHQPPKEVLHMKEGLVPESPIIPLFTAHARSLAEYLQRRGFMVRPIVAPTVPAGTDRVRLCLHAGNTTEEVQGLCRAVDEWVGERLSEGNEPSEHPSKL